MNTPNSYHFITHWHVPGTVKEVNDILGDAESLPRWWPSVYLDVKMLERGQPGGVGRRIGLFTKGWLPYTLVWEFVVTHVGPLGFGLRAQGDFVGQGEWTFAQNGEITDIVYDWRISAEKPLLKYLSFIMKPVFKANHEWAMARGLHSLQLELRRRRGEANVPQPQGPTFAALIPTKIRGYSFNRPRA